MLYGLNVINAWPAKFILELAVVADEAGWNGFFLWDYLTLMDKSSMEDPWVLLRAITARTKNLRRGAFITLLPRHRHQVVSKKAVTLDHLSNGRAVLGVSSLPQMPGIGV